MDVPPHSLPPASLTALTEAAAAINSTLELESVLQTISRLACRVARAEASNVFLLQPREHKLKVVAATGHRRDALIDQEFSADTGIPGQVVRSGQPINVPDVRTNARFSREIDDISSLKTRCLLAAPMVYRSEVIGVVEVVNRLDETLFDDIDLKVLQLFATLAATATQNARVHQDLKQRYQGLRESVMKKGRAIIGDSPLLKRVLELCRRVARSNATVLILGETGTGKELCAQYIHNASSRRDEAFVAINCAALTETLLESELFGHEKGSFTGAHAQRHGCFEVADGGTLFLDEIGDISRSTQAKLLRVLQEKEFVRVGGTKPIACNVRIVAATNRNLKNMMADGLFRDDLYYRLSVFPIQMPALRERAEDIPSLAAHFVNQAVREFGIPQLEVAPATMAMLGTYEWPGNIRELQNVIDRSVLMSDGSILLPAHLPPELEAVSASGGSPDDTSTLRGQERSLIVKALEQNDWNQSQAARDLGITRYHLRHRLKKYQIQKPEPRRQTA
ncbi:MAG: sigma 54-interacting transcriptional regulator [Planctomycetes bacterium]|nr:sigma 54-interacting transcriptional regulator [Planctomycetota bacterium]